jgi:predicted AAA+ superfamily ATPase
MIRRFIENTLLAPGKSKRGKILVIMGARQTGKTTMLKELFAGKENALFLNGDEGDVRSLFENPSSTRLKVVFGNKQIVIIDEAQRIKNIGLLLKLIADNGIVKQLIATGSSSFELANEIKEPLTGRKREFQMYPLSFAEMVHHHGLLEEKRLIPHRMIYGYYPEVVNNPGNEREILLELSDSYLYKDVLMWERIKKPEKLVKLLQALALQMGSQVSYSELGQLCGLDAKTVEKYLVLLEQCFVIFRLGSFSRNLRNELKFSRKIYFFDNGIRNSLLADFTIAENRRDLGALWENFLVSERIKKLECLSWENGIRPHTWFWRTVSHQEIDYIEDSGGKLSAYEFKWNPAAKHKKPESFFSAYPDSSFTLINPENVEDFLL